MLAWMISRDISGVYKGCSSAPVPDPDARSPYRRPLPLGSRAPHAPSTRVPPSRLPNPWVPYVIPRQTDTCDGPRSRRVHPRSLRAGVGGPLARENAEVTWPAGRGWDEGGACPGAGPAASSGGLPGAPLLRLGGTGRGARRRETSPEVSALPRRSGGAGRGPGVPGGAGTGPLVAIGRLFPSRGVLGCFQLSSGAPSTHFLDPFLGPRSSLLGAPGGGGRGGARRYLAGGARETLAVNE